MLEGRVSRRELEAEKGAAPHSIMNQLIPLQMMDQVAMTTDAVLPRAWRRGLFPRTIQSRLRVELDFGFMWIQDVINKRGENRKY